MNAWERVMSAPCAWLGDGAEDNAVLSSRIRLARNVTGRPFPQRARTTDRAALVRHVLEHTAGSERLHDGAWLELDGLERVQRQFLGERHLVSPELVESPECCAVAIAPDQSTAVMVNEEDHLRIQALRPGLDLDAAYRAADALDDELDARLEYAFSERLGFLTACPTNAGTGMRASVLMHLPGLVRHKEVERAFGALRSQALTVRGFYGEGSVALGNFFQVSNGATLGRREADVLERLDRATRELLAWEQQARDALWTRARSLLEDWIWRSYGLLRHARMLTAEEVLKHASAVRLGVALGVVTVPVRVLNEILVHAQPAHVQILGGTTEANHASIWRATMVREKLRQIEG